jgi:hypothetical protein
MSQHARLTTGNLNSPSQEVIENNTLTTIPALRCVRFTGFGIKFPTVTISLPLTEIVRGVTQKEILPNKVGIVTSLGFMENVDTSAWTVGTLLYNSIGGLLSPTVLGLPIATVIKSDPLYGILYIDNTGITINDITAAFSGLAWSLSGNTGINPAITFLGTTDAQPLIIKTNNNQRAIINENGRIGLGNVDPQASLHLKFHTGDNNTGRLIDTFSVSSNVNTWANAYTIILPLNSTAMIEIDLAARQSDGLEKASFKRVGTFSKSTVMASITQDGPIQSSYTYKSANGFNIRYRTTLNTVFIDVQNANITDTNWVGAVNSTIVVAP